MSLVEKIAKASMDVGNFVADKVNNEQHYAYISADQVLAKAGDALARNGVALIPSVLEEEVTPVDRGGGKVRYDARTVFNMVLTDGETSIESVWVGRGSDYSVPDKATYKSYTSGHKYFLMKTLNIGVGNEDSEHENENGENTSTTTGTWTPAPQHPAGGNGNAATGTQGQAPQAPQAQAPQGQAPTSVAQKLVAAGIVDDEGHANGILNKIGTDNLRGKSLATIKQLVKNYIAFRDQNIEGDEAVKKVLAGETP